MLRSVISSRSFARISGGNKRLTLEFVAKRRIPKPISHQKDEHVPLNVSDNLFEQTRHQETLGTISSRVTLGKDNSESTLKRGCRPEKVLGNSALVIGRQLEMLNVLIGFEQANKYSIRNASGQIIGYMVEDTELSSVFRRQILGNRRNFNILILDVDGKPVLKVARPIKWFLNSTITISDTNDNPIGQVYQRWHLFRRQYDLFVSFKQFAEIDSPTLAWEFFAVDDKQRNLALIDKKFKGFAREIFTDANQYVILYDAVPDQARPLTLDERAVVLAAAITVDIDYFSRTSGLPIPFFGFYYSTD